MRKVLILSGISGSGKTTLIEELLVEHRHPEYKDDEHFNPTSSHHSADAFFWNPKDRKYEFDATKLSLAHGACFRGYIESLVAGPGFFGASDAPSIRWQNENHLVLVDNTNTTTEEISPYILGAQAYGYDAEVITLVKPVNMNWGEYSGACFRRNSHGVSEQGVQAQYQRILNRRLPPWWKVSERTSKFST